MRSCVRRGWGFIGSHRVEHPCREGHETPVLDGSGTGRPNHLKGVAAGLAFVTTRVTEIADRACAVRGADHVLPHLEAASVMRLRG